MVKLQDIADELNVSVSLVSKVLNDRLGNTRVNDNLAGKIRKTADKLGYRKNRSALALLRGRQDVLAVLIHRHGHVGSGLVEAFLDGVASTMKTTGNSRKQLISFFGSHEEFLDQRRQLHRGMVDGVIINGVRHDWLSDELAGITARGVPVVTVFNDPLTGLPNVPNVGIGGEEALLRVATTHLVHRGCRDILHIASVAGRNRGYRVALEAAGIKYRPSYVFDDPKYAHFDPAAAVAAVRDALRRKLPFDGVAAPSDGQAVAAVNELVRQGVRVPDDVKVIGVDGAAFGQMCIVPISSVGQKYYERGRLAVDLVTKLIAGQPATSVSVEPELLPADSTAVSKPHSVA